MGSLDRETIGRLRTLASETDPALFAEILTLFVSDLPNYLAGIEQALAGQDAGGLARHAHAMKGASVNTGALRLGALSEHVEAAAAGGNLGAVASMLAELVAEVRRVEADIALELSATA